jgi:hypothetical protein
MRKNPADLPMKRFLIFGYEKKASEVSARTLRTHFSYSFPVIQCLPPPLLAPRLPRRRRGAAKMLGMC